MVTKNTDISKETSFAKTERGKQISQLEHALIIFVLKKFSDREHPLSAPKIADYISEITGEEHIARTIRRKLQHLATLQETSEESLINNTLCLTFGGHIVEVSNKGKMNIKKEQCQYYFQPLLNSGDLALICGAITSNRYLTDSEKNYLLEREKILGTITDDAKTLDNAIQNLSNLSLFEKQTSDSVYGDSHLLKLVNQVYDAIENGYMIEIIYGIYDLESPKQKLRFRARNPEKPYKLNPYAMLWNNGAFYLLATHDGHDNPVHFRMDRIVSIKPIVTPDDARIMQPRAPYPPMLKPYFKPLGNRKYEFWIEKYTATFPLMGIYDETNFIDCKIECTSATLSILIDAFGTGLRIVPSPIPHNEKELDFHGKPQTFLCVNLRNVQYDNILQFCLQQHTSLTVLSPSELVEDVKKGLLTSLEKYDKFSD